MIFDDIKNHILVLDRQQQALLKGGTTDAISAIIIVDIDQF